MTRKDINMYDEDVNDLILESIPDETLTIKRTLSGTVSLNRRGIYNLALRGMSVQDIAKCFGVTDNTIQTHFKLELNAGRGMIGPRLKHNLLRQAMATEKPNPQLLIFALKNYTELTEDGPNIPLDSLETVEWKIDLPVFEHRTELTESEKEEFDEE